jgi:hypothetical protein
MVRRITEGETARTVDRELESLALQAKDDSEYSQIVLALQEGKSIVQLPSSHPARQLSGEWDQLGLEITTGGPLVTMGNRLFIPRGARGRLLANLHATHPGRYQMLLSARELWHWPQMKADVIRLVESCDSCDRHSVSRLDPRPQTQENIEHLMPMELVSLDLHHLKGRNYLSAQDRASGFRWCMPLRHLRTSEVIRQTDLLICRYGCPTRIKTDGGAQFRGAFQTWCESLGIDHTCSSPYNPRSNSGAESAVRLSKSLQKRTGAKDADIERLTLLSNQLLSQDGSGSPADKFFRRKLRAPGVTRLPSALIDHQRLQRLRQEAVQIRRGRKLKRSHFYTEQFAPGDRVVVQNCLTKLWDTRGRIIKQRPSNDSKASTSFFLDTDEGKVILRNRKYIRISRSPAAPGSETVKKVRFRGTETC